VQILAHRGYWNETVKANSWQSFVMAFEKGYGIETDFRDLNGSLVVSHDPATNENAILAADFFKLAAAYPQQWLALNIKADGLQQMLADYIQQYNLTHYFAFDASVPDLYRYRAMGSTYFTRISDIEPEANLMDTATGIWLDAFAGEWYTLQTITDLLEKGKKVAIVSPELHKRPHQKLWELLSGLQAHPEYKQLLLCTDFPDEAKIYFNTL
jgi:glycerophosphoryl diester phosphodiesterase